MLEKIRLIRDIILFVITNAAILFFALGTLVLVGMKEQSICGGYTTARIVGLIIFPLIRFFVLYFSILLLSEIGSHKTKQIIENIKTNFKAKLNILFYVVAVDFVFFLCFFKNPAPIINYLITMAVGLLPTYLFTFLVFWLEKVVKIPEKCATKFNDFNENFLKPFLIFIAKIIYFGFSCIASIVLFICLMDLNGLSVYNENGLIFFKTTYILSAISLLIFMWAILFWKMKLYKKILCIAILFFWTIFHLLFTQYPCVEMNICHQGLTSTNEKGEKFKVNQQTCLQNGYKWNNETKFCNMNINEK